MKIIIAVWACLRDDTTGPLHFFRITNCSCRVLQFRFCFPMILGDGGGLFKRLCKNKGPGRKLEDWKVTQKLNNRTPFSVQTFRQESYVYIYIYIYI